MPQKDTGDFSPPRESSGFWPLLLLILLLALGAGWWFWWRPAHAPAPAAATLATASDASDAQRSGTGDKDADASGAQADTHGSIEEGAAAATAGRESAAAASATGASADANPRDNVGSDASQAGTMAAAGHQTDTASSSDGRASAETAETRVARANASPQAASGSVARLASEAPADRVEARNPVTALAAPESDLPSVGESDARVAQALKEQPALQRAADALQLDGFVRRAVATVDNLGRPYAPVRMWPVQPTEGRFTVVDPDASETTIAPTNAARYGAFVALAESVPLDAAVHLYARLYPLFQSAYENLGYPGGYFNDRLVAVLDLLLDTPIPDGPVAVELTEIKGKFASTRPWVRYEYADPALQSLASGQKILIRMGPDNARRLKAVLWNLRGRLATGAIAEAKAH